MALTGSGPRRAFSKMFLSMSNTFGGSTITQKLIKTHDRCKNDVTVKRKLLEIFRALDFEKRYTKQDIIEWYLNLIYLGEAYGCRRCIQVYFGKDVRTLP
jgi:penicillin-binding protein 1A